MLYRLNTILPRKNYTADAVELIDIDIIDPISQILFTHEVNNVSSGLGATGHPIRCISKIELVDGSTVLESLSGQEAQAVDFYHRGKEPSNLMLYMDGIYSEVVAAINFGRFLYDPLLAWDPKKFTNPQLKVTIDLDGGGCNATDGYLTVIAHIFDEKKISPVGFLMTKEVKQYTLANGSHEYTELPRDFPYRQLFLRAQRYGTGPEDQIDTVKISEDADKRVPLNHTMKQILRNVAAGWGTYKESIIMSGGTSAHYYYCTPCNWPKFAGAGWRNTANIGSAAFYGGDGGRFQRIMDTYAGNVQAHIEGYAPHAVVPLLPKFSDDLTDVYDVSKIGDLKLDVLAGSSVGTDQTAEIITQQLKKY